MLDLAVSYSIQRKQNQIMVPQRQFILNRHCQIFTKYYKKVYQAVSDKRVIEGNKTLPYGY